MIYFSFGCMSTTSKNQTQSLFTNSNIFFLTNQQQNHRDGAKNLYILGDDSENFLLKLK
jgi:hypothetical protein